MECLWTILLVSALPQWSSEVQLSMQGTVNLGRDVVEVLSRYIDEKRQSGRRSYGGDGRTVGPEDDDDSNSDTIVSIVDSAYLCNDLDLCKGDLGPVVNKYIIMLTEAVESVFKGLVKDINNNNDENTLNIVIFEDELKGLIKDIRKILRTSNNEIREHEESFTWVNLIKKINAKFINKALAFASQRLEGGAKDILDIKKKLAQEIVIVTSLIELKFESFLCAKHDICSRTFECTKSLNVLLEHLKSVPDDRAKEFLKYFNEELRGTNFYNTMSEDTAREFQTILGEMANSDNILTKNVLQVVHKNVENRQNILVSKYKVDDSRFGRDVKLVHIMLSDMDFFYIKQKSEPFSDFLSDFFDWAKEGGRFGSPMRRVMKDIQNKLSFASDDLVMKLIHEVKVFLEITIDPTS